MRDASRAAVIAAILTIITLGACSYSPSRTTATDGSLEAGADGSGAGDADPDGGPADGPMAITLSQTTGPSGPGIAQAVGCTTNGGATIADGAWYRVFPLASFGITGTFTLTKVSFWVWKTQGARTATVNIGTYTGAFQGTAFQPSQLQSLHQGDVTAPSSAPPGQLVTATLVTPIVINAAATPQIAIKISSGDLLLGEAASQTAYGYFGSNTCGGTAALPPDAPGSPFILTLEGTR
jgi:hypothetical protein